MATIYETDAGEHACPYRDFQPCLGAKCMAWGWSGRPADYCETDNLVETEDGPRPVGSPATPEGDGWAMDGGPFSKGYHRSKKEGLPAATGQRWIRELPKARGHCSRVAPDQYGPW